MLIMGYPRAIADPATLVAIAWVIIATFSSLLDAFYVSKITSKPSCIIAKTTRTKISQKTFTKRLILFILFISTILLIVSTTVLALNVSTVGTTPSPQVLVAPVQIRTSDRDRDQLLRDMARFFRRDLNEKPPAPVVLLPLVPPQTVPIFNRWLVSSSKMATYLSLFMPMVIIYGTLLAVASNVLDTDGPHLVPVIVVVACAAVRSRSRGELSAALVLSHAKFVVWIVSVIVQGLLIDLFSPFIQRIESGLTFIKYLVGLSGGPLLIRSVKSFINTHTRYPSTSVLTQLLPRAFLPQYMIAITMILLVRLLVRALAKRYHVQLVEALVFLRRAAATLLMALAIRLDPSSEHSILAQDPSAPQARATVEQVIKAKKDQEDVPAVEGSPVAITPSSDVPVDLSVFLTLGTRLKFDKGPKEICKTNHSLRQTMINDQRYDPTCLVSIYPPPATVSAVIEDLLKDPASVLRGSPRNISLTGSELIYILTVVLEEYNRRHRAVNDSLVKNNETAEARIRSEARKCRVLTLELNALKGELKHIRQSMGEPKDIATIATCMGDSVLHQIEDGKTASASKPELAAPSTHAGGLTKPFTEDDTPNLLEFRSSLRALRNLVRAMLVPEHYSKLAKNDEIDGSDSHSTPHPPACDLIADRHLIADCDFACIEISRAISLLAIQRSVESNRNYAILKGQQAFREGLTDQVTELRKEYETQLQHLYTLLEREKTAHGQTKELNNFYLRLSSKREYSLKEEVGKRKHEVKQLQQDVYCLRRKVKDTEALKQELFRPVDSKEWLVQWFSKGRISKVTGTILEQRYKSAMKDLDKVIAQMDVLATQSDLASQHAEILHYICSKLFKVDSDVADAQFSAIFKHQPASDATCAA